MTSRSFGANPFQRRRHSLAGALLLTAVALCFAGCSPKSDDKPATTASNVTLTDAQRQHIKVYTVALSQFHKSIDTTGVVDFDNDQATSVMAAISGPVSRILVNPGQKVAKGQPLAIVASPDYAVAVSTYRKAISTAQTLRHVADMDKDLLAHDGVALREEQQAQTDAAGAEADRDAALQALVGLGLDPKTIQDVQAGRAAGNGEGVIRAPIAGTVAEKLITPGQLLQAGTTAAFTIADLSKVWVMAQIFDTDISSISVGDQAKVQTDAGSEEIPGTVDNISALVNPDTRSVVARVVVANPGDRLKKQMYVQVQIRARQASSGLLVPVSAILRDDENLPFVYVMQRDGSFARSHVTLGSRTGDQYVIDEGVKAGDQVVTDGGLFVQFMQNQ